MRFRLFDTINSPASRTIFRLDQPTFDRVEAPEISQVPCKNFCGFKNLAVSNGNVSVEDCRECLRHEILSGVLTSDHGDDFEIVNGRPQFAVRIIHQRNGLRIVETEPQRDPRWRPFIANNERSLVYHSPEWIQTLAEEYGQRSIGLAAESEDDQLIGILPLLYTRGLPFNLGMHRTRRRLASLPRTPTTGPIAATPEVEAELLGAAFDVANETPGTDLQVKSLEALPSVSVGLTQTVWRPTYVLDLPRPGEQLNLGSAKNRHNIKWAINKAVKLGLQVRPAETEHELSEWYVLYLHTMRRNFCPPRPYRFFESLWRQLRPSSNLQLLLAEDRSDGKKDLIAGSIFLQAGSTVFYAFTGCKTQTLSTHANDLILWTAIHDCSAAGFSHFDLGECPEEHPELVRFKTKWGAKPIPQYRYQSVQSSDPMNHINHVFSPSKIRKLMERVWSRIPLSVTARVGETVYKYL